MVVIMRTLAEGMRAYPVHPARKCLHDWHDGDFETVGECAGDEGDDRTADDAKARNVSDSTLERRARVQW